jgi:hypothetical protein
MDMEIMRMKARKEVELSHKTQLDDLYLKIEQTQKDRDDMRRSLEYLRAEHENLKVEYDKEKLTSKTKYREELDVVIRENEGLHQ